jgi:3-keto-5-aminohexanoate cleavage enzyme
MSDPNAARSPAVLCVAPNGARRSRTDHAAIPLAPHELARDAMACREAGASVMHLHVRDDEGRHSLAADRYRAAIRCIEDAVGQQMLIQVTTEAVGIYTAPQQMALVRELRPAAASVGLRELVPDESAAAEAASFFAWARREHIALQFIVYSPEEAQRLARLARDGVLAVDAPNTLFVLGRYTRGQQSNARHLVDFLNGWPDTWPWSVCAFGVAEAQCMAAAIGLGGHARVGFENNLQRPDGSRAAGNADLVANARAIVAATGRTLASVDEARRIYGATRA